MTDDELFQPFVSFRESNNTIGFSAQPRIAPQGGLTRSSLLLLLIHGFNNTMEGATESYSGWRDLQQALGGINEGINVAAVYWPASNFENFAVYMQTIGKATESARRLADVLREKANAFGLLRVRVVTHSLGGRLLLELIRELNDNPSPRLQIESFVVMAAAVPTFMLQPADASHNRPLRVALDAAMNRRFRSLFSRHDWVVGWVFRLGETLRGEGLLAVSLGSREWTGPSAIAPPRLTQQEISGASHGDYWPSRNNLMESHGVAAGKSIRELLQVGPAPREIAARDLDARDTPSPRDTAAGRTTPSRTTRG